MVGRSHECDYPAPVAGLPVCSEPKFSLEGSSLDIHKRVKEVLENALSVYRVNIKKLQELSPTIIVTQDHCEVCAVSLKDVEEAVCRFLVSRPKIVALSPKSLKDVHQNFRNVASALKAQENAESLISRMHEGVFKIRNKTKKLSPKFKVALLEWINPIWTSGSWTPELIEYAGGQDVLGEKGRLSHSIDFKDLANADPELIMIAPCGYDLSKIREEISPLTTHIKWKGLKAVRNKRVYIADGNQYFNRPGPRLLDSLQILAEIIYPEHFNFGYEGEGWRHLL